MNQEMTVLNLKLENQCLIKKAKLKSKLKDVKSMNRPLFLEKEFRNRLAKEEIIII